VDLCLYIIGWEVHAELLCLHVEVLDSGLVVGLSRLKGSRWRVRP
jgi:hypothetical protein